MKNIEILPHTADIRIKVEGTSLEELFRAGASAIAGILSPGFQRDSGETEVIHDIDFKSANATSLFVDFLSEVLTLSYVEKSIFYRLEFRELTERSVSATVHGQVVNGFDEDIKAVTYHEADVRLNESGRWETVFIIDI